MDLIEAEGIKKRWQEYTEFSLVTQWCPALCNPIGCSMPGFPVHHQLPELAQTHFHCIGDAIQPSHPLSSPSSPASILSSIRVFSIESALHWYDGRVLELQLQPQSFQWIFRTDFFYSWLVWSPCSPRDSQESSPAPQFESISSLELSLLYCLTLTSVLLEKP